MRLLWLAAAVIAAIFIASIIPGPYASVRRASPAGAIFPSARFDVATGETIRRACLSCHSNETEWPWYSHVAPVSWLVRKDVSEGREFLNFSQWAAYGTTGQSQLLTLAAGRIKDGKMPPKRYVLLHPEAKLSDQERSDLIKALERESARLSQSVKPKQ
jgi:hypothetical protein